MVYSVESVCVTLQVFSYTANKEIRTDDLCLDVSKLNGPVMMLKCHHLKGNQLWEYDPLVSGRTCETLCEEMMNALIYWQSEQTQPDVLLMQKSF